MYAAVPAIPVSSVTRISRVAVARTATRPARSGPSAMHYCAVDGCSSSKRQKHISFFRLPKEEETRKKWLQLIGRPDIATSPTNPNNHFVCSLHFEESMMISVPKLKPDALPTKLLPNSTRLISYDEKSTQTDELKIDITSALIYANDNKSSSGQSATDSMNPQTSVPLSPAARKRKPRESKDTEQKRRKQQNGASESEKEAQNKNYCNSLQPLLKKTI
ncbi:unnamed protein product [Diatraea saccharalis]|uniref:THAP-type domain-containing protein n=1 Tax=Diatraea saccharalis TaxID=40085 RepID=A0A9N9R448_9NEOP|nr:unnamed protein product [Diatraea saccharalis]